MKDSTCGGIPNMPIQDYRYTFNGKACNKYYPGASFMVLPFFAAAHFITAWHSPYPPDGYSLLYFKIIPFSGVFYYFLGMLFFLKILEKLGLNTLQKSLTIFFVTFGSNMIYYIIDAPIYSHIYSFALIAVFIYYALALRDKFTPKNLLWLSFLAGFIFITRPVNISVFLFLPFIFNGKIKSTLANFNNEPVNFLYLLPSLIMPAILVILYKLSTGQFFIYSYGKEGFDFLHPHFWQFIFSYDNGIFPYMPLLFMPVLFLFAWYKRAYKSMVRGLALTLLVTIYIHSSWWCWDYSFSFGARTMLDFMPLFGIMIGLSLKQTNKKRYFYLLPVYFLCCSLTLLLYNQKSAGHFMNIYPITDYWESIYSAFGIK